MREKYQLLKEWVKQKKIQRALDYFLTLCIAVVLVGGGILFHSQIGATVGTVAENITSLLSKANIHVQFGEGKNEESLRKRYEEYKSAIYESKNYKRAYGILAGSVREKYSEEEFINALTNSGKSIKREDNINQIAIRENLGFIDRTFCNGEDCISEKMKRSYQQWIYIDKNWYFTLYSPTCIREEAYDKPAEFERALSLISQRTYETYRDQPDYFNCVDIQYSDAVDAEGIFFFDSNVSSPERLVIHVNNSYRWMDDLSTSILLYHEIIHAQQYLDFLRLGEEVGCIDSEVQAYMAQFQYTTTLNDEEKKSIVARLNEYEIVNNQFEIIKDLIRLRNQALVVCNNSGNPACESDTFTKIIRGWIEQNPYYKEQCGLS
ncbi:MAG TPA: hypothetical protein VJC10_03685 [Patescibacteria group bacterium]|nr:hypothetical protein [Patescibacteria group bacterium]